MTRLSLTLFIILILSFNFVLATPAEFPDILDVSKLSDSQIQIKIIQNTGGYGKLYIKSNIEVVSMQDSFGNALYLTKLNSSDYSLSDPIIFDGGSDRVFVLSVAPPETSEPRGVSIEFFVFDTENTELFRSLENVDFLSEGYSYNSSQEYVVKSKGETIIVNVPDGSPTPLVQDSGEDRHYNIKLSWAYLLIAFLIILIIILVIYFIKKYREESLNLHP